MRKAGWWLHCRHDPYTFKPERRKRVNSHTPSLDLALSFARARGKSDLSHSLFLSSAFFLRVRGAGKAPRPMGPPNVLGLSGRTILSLSLSLSLPHQGIGGGQTPWPLKAPSCLGFSLKGCEKTRLWWVPRSRLHNATYIYIYISLSLSLYQV